MIKRRDERMVFLREKLLLEKVRKGSEKEKK